MTFDEFRDAAKMMNAIFARGDHVMFDSREKVIAWYSCLSDLDNEGFCKAVRNIALKDSHFEPGISDIREEYFNLTTTPGLSEQEAWEMVVEGIRNGYYGCEEEFAKLPPDVQKAVSNSSALREWAQLPSEDVHTVIQSLFKKNYRTVMQRVREEAALGQIGTRAGALKELSENLAKKLEVK